MQQGDRAKRWLGRGVLGLAALACIATSRPRWRIEAELPAGLAAQTPIDGTQGLLVTVSASTMPSVACELRGGTHTELRPLPIAGAAAPDPSYGQYLCPPGGRLTRVAIDGSGGGGSHAKPPADAFIRITKLETVETWRTTSEATFVLAPWLHGETYADVTLSVGTAQPVYLEAALAEGTDAAAFGSVNIMGPSRDGRPYDFVLPRLKDTLPPDSKLRVRATVFGVCEPGCTPPPTGTITLTPAPQ